ncbi:MAG: hypothetical protein IKP78_09920, partial [Ruminococcus sp.]|nr:hypothetical protein [Ruminococcus sp.]
FRGSVFLSRDFVPAQAVIHFIQLIQVGSPRRQVRAPVFLGRDFVSAPHTVSNAFLFYSLYMKNPPYRRALCYQRFL